jgi:hypothetical protein
MCLRQMVTGLLHGPENTTLSEKQPAPDNDEGDMSITNTIFE